MFWGDIFNKINSLGSFLFEIIFPKSETSKILSTITHKELLNKNKISRVNKSNLDNSDHISIFKYGDPFIRKSIKELKYFKNKDAVRLFSKLLYEELNSIFYISLNQNSLNQSDSSFTTITARGDSRGLTFLLIPIPLSKIKFRERGFNQCELLCEEIIKLNSFSPSPLPLIYKKDLLIKIKNTKSQTRVSKEERVVNIKNAFAINPASPKASQDNKMTLVILLDDVYTTGATMREAVKVLEKAGVRKIKKVTIAD